MLQPYPDIEAPPPIVCGTFPLVGPPRLFGLYEIDSYDGVSTPPAFTTCIGWGLEFEDRAISLLRGEVDTPWALGIHSHAREAAALYSSTCLVQARYV